MKRLVATTLLVLFTLTLPACGQSMKKPDIKLNPHPKMRYELTLTVHDAPGPFESVTGFMQYEVQNEQECVPADAISGHHQRLSIDPDIEFKRAGDSQIYKGTVYLDWVQDGDYYGLGGCRWKMVGFSGVMKAGEVTFNPFISGDQIATQQSKTEFFAKKIYREKFEASHAPLSGELRTTPGLYVGGVAHSEWIAQQPEKFFSTTLSAKEDFQ
ncbi:MULTISPECIES: hypothetical protein [Variovorax]|uniref:hypothetical protein n=1 Tax=Variovorax TaxID=34072 RepID=UPI00285B4A9C|nr:hypothetical protein [Variovorax sp. 3319]MDR6889017.1 hypothetical protein [Variovorax sp. 3319]